MENVFEYRVQYLTLEKKDGHDVPAQSSQSFENANPLNSRSEAFNLYKKASEIYNLQTHYGKKAIIVFLTIRNNSDILDSATLVNYHISSEDELLGAEQELQLYRKYNIETDINVIEIGKRQIISPRFGDI